jgi:hypothetical protein
VSTAALGSEPSSATAVTSTTSPAGGVTGACDFNVVGGKGSRGAGGAQRGGNAADEVVLPGEYEKVIELLKKRGEKGHMILAQSEVSSKGFLMLRVGSFYCKEDVK